MPKVFDDQCINCSEYKRCKDSFTSWIFFIIGIIATIALRIVTLASQLNPLYGKLAWYIGVMGFFVFFIYKYRGSLNRARLIDQRNLVDKINREESLTKEDYALIAAILCALRSRKERINYFVIFSLSAVAIFLALYMDFLR